jgi:inosine-uridine nucleoside N-ribohydrolase
LLDRFLGAVGRSDIPVATGIQTPMPESHFTQRRYAEREARNADSHADAVTSTLEQIRKHPGVITLIAIGPLFNIGAMIDRDPATFRKLKRVVMMGGSIYLGSGDLSYFKPHGPDPEWNILQDISGAQKLIASGVPIYMMPLDATQLKLDEVKRSILFKHDTALTDQLVLLYQQWGALTPTLYDPMAVSYAINPDLCPAKPLRIYVDAAGYTRTQAGQPNVYVCLHSDPEQFFSFYMRRLLNP